MPAAVFDEVFQFVLGIAAAKQLIAGKTVGVEHVVELEADLILAAEIRPADEADTATLADSLAAAQLNLKAAGSEPVIEEAAADKGYHAAATIELCDFLDVRTYIPEPKLKEPRGGRITRRRSGRRRRTTGVG